MIVIEAPPSQRWLQPAVSSVQAPVVFRPTVALSTSAATPSRAATVLTPAPELLVKRRRGVKPQYRGPRSPRRRGLSRVETSSSLGTVAAAVMAALPQRVVRWHARSDRLTVVDGISGQMVMPRPQQAAAAPRIARAGRVPLIIVNLFHCPREAPAPGHSDPAIENNYHYGTILIIGESARALSRCWRRALSAEIRPTYAARRRNQAAMDGVDTCDGSLVPGRTA